MSYLKLDWFVQEEKKKGNNRNLHSVRYHLSFSPLFRPDFWRITKAFAPLSVSGAGKEPRISVTVPLFSLI